MERGKVQTLSEVISLALNSTNTRNSTTAVKAVRQGEVIPAFLTDPKERELYLQTDLDYKTYLREMATLEGIKRDHFEPVTLELWYREFIRMGWKKALFLEQCQKVKMNKKFGKIDFNDFLADERVYTASELQALISEAVWHKVQFGYNYLALYEKGFKLTPDEMTAAAYYASEKLQKEYETERREAFEREVQKEMEKARERVNVRRKMIRKLSSRQKLFLIHEAMKEKFITYDTSPTAMNTYMNYTELFADLIPEGLIEQASNYTGEATE